MNPILATMKEKYDKAEVGTEIPFVLRIEDKHIKAGHKNLPSYNPIGIALEESLENNKKVMVNVYDDQMTINIKKGRSIYLDMVFDFPVEIVNKVAVWNEFGTMEPFEFELFKVKKHGNEDEKA